MILRILRDHAFVTRLLLIMPVLLMAACGQEAPPRAERATPAPAATRVPTTITLPTTAADTGASMTAPAMDDAAPAALNRTLGDPNAPITVIEYSDYQWPFCARFVRETKPKLEQHYIATGKVYYIYRDFPLIQIHPGALLASHAANCAGAQDSFWPMNARLFGGQDAGEWQQGGERDFRTFVGYATELKLDTAAFEQCVKGNRFASLIEHDYDEAIQQGVRSTPTFVVNGELFIGAQPFSAWQQKLDSLLADK